MITDHGDKELSTAGGEGKVVLQGESSKMSVRLEPAGSNVLKGVGDFVITQSTSAVIFVKLRDQDAYSARYPAPKPANPKTATHSGAAAREHHRQHMMHH